MDKYLQLGTYTHGCSTWLLDKVKSVENNKIDAFYIEKILEIIKQEFDPKIHQITTTHDFRTSRFINVADILKKKTKIMWFYGNCCCSHSKKTWYTYKTN